MAETPDDFANAPRSVTEIRAEREHDARKWTPRDVLINLLRDIDNGMKIDACVIFYRHVRDDGAFGTFFSQSSPDRYVCLGVANDGLNLLQMRKGD